MSYTSTVGPPVDEATLSFVQRVAVASEETTPHHSLNEAFDAFSTAFRRWNPKQLRDIKPSDNPVIDFLFSSSFANSKVLTHLAPLRNTIHQIVLDWMQTWNRKSLKSDELLPIAEMLQSDTWDTYRDFHSIRGDVLFRAHVNSFRNSYYFYSSKQGRDFLLPAVQDVQCRIDELNVLAKRIQEYTQVEIHGQTYQLADTLGKYKKDYNCIYDTKYEGMLLPEQIRHLQMTFGWKPDVIYHLTYFDIYPSVLFDDVTIINSGYSRKEKHISTIDHALSRIKPAIGSEMTYDGVAYALNLLPTTVFLNTELKTLLSNEMLQLTSLDVTNFRAVKLLYDISKPLQGFIKACELYKFQIVESDATFKSLQTEVKTFYATESTNRRTCLSFFNRLYDILYFPPPGDNNHPAVSDHPHLYLLHKIKELTKVMVLLESLSFVSHGPKLWQYCRDMGWFKHDTKFDQDYHSLSIALTNFDALPEALIVEPLGPVVRYFILFEKLQQCQSINLLLFKARNECEIQTTKQATPTILEDIHKLNSRLKSIKDLFQNVYNLPSITNSVPTPQSTTTSHANIYRRM